MIFAVSFASAQLSISTAHKSTVFNNNFSFPVQKPVPATSMMVQPSFYSCNIGFFCKQELKIERVTGFPVKFRLGSVQYVDYLERKPGAAYLMR